jgi:hypothetical protein
MGNLLPFAFKDKIVGSPEPFVFIIESPSSNDLFEERGEGKLLQKSLELSGTKAFHTVAADPASFRRALGDKLIQAWKSAGNFSFPIIHISAHGNSGGIGLTNEYFINWEELADLIRPINLALSGRLILCLSACSGTSGCQMAMNHIAELPFHSLVSNSGTPCWSDAAIAFATFYHLLLKGSDFASIREAMDRASGDSNWVIMSGEGAKQRWCDHIHQQNEGAMDVLARALAGQNFAQRRTGSGNA